MSKLRILRVGLLPRVILAIILGVALGNVLTAGWVRVFVTFNALFSQFLGFMIPLIIIGLVTPAIGDIGRGAGKLLLITVILAYGDTVLSGLLSYSTGSWLFPDMVAATPEIGSINKVVELTPYFAISIPAFIDVMSALVLSFVLGLTTAYAGLPTLKKVFDDFKEAISLTISKVIIPLLPLYIFGIFLNMTFSGQAYRILIVFAQIIVVIFVLHLLVLVYEFSIAGIVTRRNPLRLLLNMLPAYMTALGTSSSAASIPVTLRCAMKIHMSGSCMKITACALTVCLLEGLPHDPLLFINFILMLGVMMVAGPGVPGGAVMAALAPLGSILGFGSNEQALIIALYIAMDSFGTACNVTGDGAIAVVVEKLKK